MSLNEHLNIPAILESLSAMEKRAAAHPTSRDADAVDVIGESIEHYRKELRVVGFAADGSDPCRVLEAVMYWFFLRSNPGYEATTRGER